MKFVKILGMGVILVVYLLACSLSLFIVSACYFPGLPWYDDCGMVFMAELFLVVPTLIGIGVMKILVWQFLGIRQTDRFIPIFVGLFIAFPPLNSVLWAVFLMALSALAGCSAVWYFLQDLKRILQRPGTVPAAGT